MYLVTANKLRQSRKKISAINLFSLVKKKKQRLQENTEKIVRKSRFTRGYIGKEHRHAFLTRKYIENRIYQAILFNFFFPNQNSLFLCFQIRKEKVNGFTTQARKRNGSQTSVCCWGFSFVQEVTGRARITMKKKRE